MLPSKMIDNSVNLKVRDVSKSSFRMGVTPKTESNSIVVNIIRIIAACDTDDIILEGASDRNGQIKESNLETGLTRSEVSLLATWGTSSWGPLREWTDGKAKTWKLGWNGSA